MPRNARRQAFACSKRAFQVLNALKEQPGNEQEGWDQDAHGPGHIAEEAGHAHALVFGNGADHEVGRVADVGIGPHKDRAGRDGGQGAGDVVHEVHGVTAGGIEEDQVGGGVVQKAGERARKPEVHGVVGLTVCSGYQLDKPGQSAVRPGPQNGDGRDHAEEDAEKELGHLFNGGPGKAVAFAAFCGGKAQRKAGKAEQQHVAQQVLAFYGHTVYRKQFAQGAKAGGQHHQHHAQQEEQVDFAVKAELFSVAAVCGRGLGLAFLGVEGRIQPEVEAEQNE